MMTRRRTRVRVRDQDASTLRAPTSVIRRFESLGIQAVAPGTVYSTPEELEGGIDPAGRGGRATPIHETEGSNFKNLPISTILSVLDEQVLRPRGIRLPIAHPESVLGHVLPVYAWDGSARPMQEAER